jgi:lysophospholipase L1-like esterase
MRSENRIRRIPFLTLVASLPLLICAFAVLAADVWKREDLAGDGTHPSQSGRQKVAEMLLTFFKTDVNAKGWFLKSSE